MNFDVKSHKGGDSGRMENSIACLNCHHIDIPVSFTVCYFRLCCLDLARFRKVTELKSVMSMASGMLAESDQDAREDIECFVQEVLSDVIVSFLSATEKSAENKEQFSKFIHEMAEPVMSFEPGVACDLEMLAAAVSTGQDIAAKCEALKQLQEKKDDEEYVGVLRKLFETEHWANISKAKGNLATNANNVDILKKEFEKCSGPIYTDTDLQSFNNAAQQVCIMCAQVDTGDKLHRQVAPLAEAMRIQAEKVFAELKCSVRDLFAFLATDDVANKLLHIQEANRSITGAKDARRKACLGFATAFKEFPSLQAVPKLHDPSKRIQELSDCIGSTINIMEGAVKVSTTYHQCDGQVDAEKAGVILRRLSDIHALFPKIAADNDVVESWNKIQQKFKSTGGAELYKDHLHKLRNVVTTMCSAFLKLKGNIGEGKVEMSSVVAALETVGHTTLQTVSWSEFPDIDRDYIEFATGPMRRVCSLAPNVHQISQCVPKGYTPDSELLNAINAVLKKEQSKPKLAWLVCELLFLTEIFSENSERHFLKTESKIYDCTALV